MPRPKTSLIDIAWLMIRPSIRFLGTAGVVFCVKIGNLGKKGPWILA